MNPMQEGAAARAECTCRERQHLEGEIDNARRLVQKLDDSLESLHEKYDALAAENARLREALESVWAAIGDALCSGNGIDTKYAQAVSSQVRAALATPRDQS